MSWMRSLYAVLEFVFPRTKGRLQWLRGRVEVNPFSRFGIRYPRAMNGLSCHLRSWLRREDRGLAIWAVQFRSSSW